MDAFAIGVGLAAAIGVMVAFARMTKEQRALAVRVRAALEGGELTLPEIVTKVGLVDGFRSRGKVMGAIQPMVAAGDVLQDEPPGTTVRDRLGLLRFRLSAARRDIPR